MSATVNDVSILPIWDGRRPGGGWRPGGPGPVRPPWGGRPWPGDRWPSRPQPQQPPYVINIPPPVVQQPPVDAVAEEEHRRKVRNILIGIGVALAVLLALGLLIALLRPKYYATPTTTFVPVV